MAKKYPNTTQNQPKRNSTKISSYQIDIAIITWMNNEEKIYNSGKKTVESKYDFSSIAP